MAKLINEGLSLIKIQLPIASAFPSDWHSAEMTQQQYIMEMLVKDLESYLGVKADRTSIADIWAIYPKKAKGQGLYDYLQKVRFYIITGSCYSVIDFKGRRGIHRHIRKLP